MAKHTHIEIYGAKQHNLKNIDVKLPKNKLIVITGLSGSGKTSLAFDTLYAEGQRRYVESLSSYARQFLGRIDKPDVKEIKGLTPSIAIEQKVISTNARSTVGTSTEIYDYLKLLYARVGKTISPISGNEVKKHNVTDVLDFITTIEDGHKLAISIAIIPEKTTKKYQEILSNQGYSRLLVNGKLIDLEDWNFEENSFLVIDRFKKKSNDEDYLQRLAESCELAFYEGNGELTIHSLEDGSQHAFNNRFELDGMEFMIPSTDLFSFNSPVGSCPSCQGYGRTIGLDKELIFPNPTKSIYDGLIAFSHFNGVEDWVNSLYKMCSSIDLSIHKPYTEFTDEEKLAIWEGKDAFKGIKGYFEYLESSSYKIQNRIILSRFRGKTECNECNGKRLRKEALCVKFYGKDIADLLSMPLDDLYDFFKSIEISKEDAPIAERVLDEINNRLDLLLKVGLPYLTLNRMSNTLSGGESQRIRLACSLSSSLVSSTYVLDEPSIGLHAEDTAKLIEVLKGLRDLGNTVVVVEHDEDIMQSADFIVDMGKEAGVQGGHIVFAGDYDNLLKQEDSYTAQYLNHSVQLSRKVRKDNFDDFIELKGARENNVQGVDINIPLNGFTVVSGMSGSGKSTLIRKILFPALQRSLEVYADKPGFYQSLNYNQNALTGVEFIDQNPIGKSSRSNPVTYIKAFDDIRNLLAKQGIASQRGYKAKHFSFNIPGGRCEECQGEGQINIEMQFLADVKMDCEHCKGYRYKDEILDVKFNDKNIFDILNLTVDQAVDFFDEYGENKIVNKLKPLLDVGLGYVKLGQSSSTLSGGEAQRVKLAAFLSLTSNKDRNLFIFDEPTTGLHFQDIQKLLNAFDALIAKGHSILVIEHHPDLIKQADWNIDLGPYGGDKGGQLIFEGLNADFLKSEKSLTAKHL